MLLISAIDLDNNERKMKTKYNIKQPFDLLFIQIKSGVEFRVTTNASFTNFQIISVSFLLIFATGGDKDKYKEWNHVPLTIILEPISNAT